MPVLSTLTEGLSSTSFTHTNPMVQTVANERQPTKHVQYSSKGITIRDEWLGTTEEIEELLSAFVPNPYTYDFEEGESYQIERQRGDLSKLTRIYADTWDSTDGTPPSDPIDESIGITPWSIKSETTDIGAIEYYILKNQLTDAEQANIKRDRLALWETAPYEYKEQFKYNTVTNGWQTLNAAPNGTVDSELTLQIAQWIVEQARSQFPLTTARITYEELVDGAAATKKKTEKPTVTKPIIKVSLKTDVEESVAEGGPLEFPSAEFGKELETIPNCPFQFNFAYPTRFMMTDWNITLHDASGKYLVTKEYVSYPAAFPLPLDPTPADGK